MISILVYSLNSNHMLIGEYFFYCTIYKYIIEILLWITQSSSDLFGYGTVCSAHTSYHENIYLYTDKQSFLFLKQTVIALP